MYVSKLFGKTLREPPSDTDTISHQLLLRAGMIHQVAAGIYSYLPLGWRVLRKIEQIVREEMDAVGGQEILMPTLQPLEIWEETGRDHSFGESLFKLKDRRERRLCLGPTHEEIVTHLARLNIRSYRDLPAIPYQIQTKFRDEPRSRGGLLRVREFLMKDMYSMDADFESLDQTYGRMIQAYNLIYEYCSLPTTMVEADSGAIGGKDSHEFMAITETGEDTIIFCPLCNYAANTERAAFNKSLPEAKEELLAIEEVPTPGAKTIEAVAGFIGVPHSQTLKVVFYTADDEVVLALIRGDLEVNEIKLTNALKCAQLRLATEDELAAKKLVAGYASPIGISGIKVVGDDSITLGANFVVGANKADAHFKNANYPRDFNVDLVTDIALAGAGNACPKCNGRMILQRGIEVGHTFKLGTVFSEKLAAMYLDRDGTQKPVVMGCYGIGLGRLLAAVVEVNNDEKGIVWPMRIAPYQVYICALNTDKPGVMEAAQELLSNLENHGIEVLFDDRSESAGVKFNDADLLGIPIRVVVSPRNLKQNSIEVKRRDQAEAELVALDQAVGKIEQLCQ